MGSNNLIMEMILSRRLLAAALFVCLLTDAVLAVQNTRLTGDERIRSRGALASGTVGRNRFIQEETLVFPGLLGKEALEAGNPLATYAAMLDLESQYLKSKIFAGIYPEVRANFEEFLGIPFAGVRAMSLPVYRRKTPSVETPIPPLYQPESALTVIQREAAK